MQPGSLKETVMRPSSLMATLALVATALMPPASAQDTVPQQTTASGDAPTADICRAGANELRVAQIHCCKANKGICGCRAGKIVCCDGTASTEAGCTCHGDEAMLD
jgi:hypothetical protein